VAGLAQIAKAQPASWRMIRARHNEALLGAALVDEQLFALVSAEVTVPTTEGDLTLPALLERCAGKVYVSLEVRSGVESVLLRALKLPVVLGNRYAAAPFSTRYTQLCAGELVILGTQEGNRQVFHESGLAAQTQAQLAEWFAAEDRRVRVCRFEPAFLPFAWVVNREVELKRRLESDEADRRMGQAILGLARNFTATLKDQARVDLYLNAAHPVVSALAEMSSVRRQLALALLQPLVALSADAQSADIESAMTAFAAALLEALKEVA
jgi:molecular chaperone HtpG